MPAEFVHLHVHSQYSLLDGAVKIKDLVKRVAAARMRAVAVTDHGNLFGAVAFYKAALEANIRPIVGCELEVRPPRGASLGHHLPVLAAGLDGYKNLIWLASRAHVAPPAAEARSNAAPVLAFEELASHGKGLIGLTGCMGGMVAQAILEQGEARGREVLGMLRDAFEPKALYVELQDHGLPEQPVLNGILVKLARELDLPLVVTNDVHYPERNDAEAHLYLSCIKTGRSLEEARERHHGSSEMYLKSPEEMQQRFASYPEALRATLEIAEACGLELKLGDPMLPKFQVPTGFDTESYFRHVAREGLEARLREFRARGQSADREVYVKRLEIELDVIAKMNFAGYFLIVWDFIRHAKEKGIPVGPGRGSGAGSLVAYAMRITDLDPIACGLIFERFLNPERVSMPDFDIDFCMDRRDEVIGYVQDKYGEVSVGQIATFAELKPKSVVKDVARAIGMTALEAQQIANLIPRKSPAETYSISESLAIEPKLKQLYEIDARVRELLDQARKLEGLTRHAGKHAAGIVISEGPLWDHVPVFRDERARSAATGTEGAADRALITQYSKDDVELAGLVKFDFLGLKTLTVLEIAVRLVNARPRPHAEGSRDGAGGNIPAATLDLSTIPMDDVSTYKLLASGETKGVFQLESDGMQKLFKELRPDCFEDIVAAVALYRPGPMGAGMHEDFVRRKHGLAPITSLHALIDDIVAPTYGVIVYQEQVMQIAQKLAGYTLGGADLLRRAMGKKKPEEMAKQKSVFITGATRSGVEEKEAERIFALLEYFAGYGFNKSHSAAYALLTYQTAWLKAHYPVELLCAILTSDKERIDKIVRTIADARALGVTVLAPDVNESDTDFKVVYTHPDGRKPLTRSDKIRDPLGPEIRFGLGAVRGLGGTALEALFEARRDGPFRDLFDLAARVDAKRVNKAVFEALVQCGAFDSTLAEAGITRARAFASIDVALERSRAASRDREAGQTTLFGLFDAAPVSTSSAPTQSAGDYAQSEPWDRREMLARERQSLGFYVSGHPLDRYVRGGAGLGKVGATPVAQCAGMEDWALVKLAGMVEGYRERIFRDGGGKVAFFDLEDPTGRVSVKIRGRELDQYGPLLARGEPVLVGGKVSFRQRGDDTEDEIETSREPTILLNEAKLLAEAVRADTRAIAIRVRAERTRPSDLASLARVLAAARGSCPVALHVSFEGGAEAVLALGEPWRVDVGDALLSGIERIFGEQVAELR